MSLKIPSDPLERSAAARAWLETARARASEALAQGDATTIAAEFAAAAEELVRQLFDRALGDVGADRPPVALVAYGGLGRRELMPHSDLDLLVLTSEPDHPAVADIADALYYPLWDARVDVGHGVRTAGDFAQLALEDDAVRTTAIDWRFVHGEAEAAETLRTALRGVLSAEATRSFVHSSIEAYRAESRDGTIYRLEPDIKNGPGGFREMQRVWWMARLVWRIDAWPELLQRGLVNQHAYDTMMRGRERLMAIRVALHGVAGRRQEQLRFELQDPVAERMGLDGGGDALLELFYRQAKAVRTAARDVLDRCHESVDPPRPAPARDLEGFHHFRGELTVVDGDQLERTPLDTVRIFRVAQRHDLPLYVHARSRISEQGARVLTAEQCATPEAARLFLDVISDVRNRGATLAAMHELGVLEKVMPELATVTGLVQRDTYHTYTVDAHLVYCARRASELLADAVDDAPELIREAAARVRRPHVLVLAALMHDVGKGHGHGHSERGAGMAEEACTRLGWSSEDRTDVAFLVREHLAMFKISQRRDLEDDELIARFAASAETLERLDLLLLLSYADATTTGPAAYNDWKGTLLLELYTRTREALIEGVARRSLRARADARLDALVRQLGPAGDAMRALAERLPPRHLVAHSRATLARHLKVVQAAADEPACLITPEAEHGGAEIIVVGRDRRGLLAELAAVMAAHGINVDAAHISGTHDGLVIDTFVIVPSAATALRDPGDRDSLRSDLETAVGGTVNVSARIRERSRADAILRSGAPEAERRVVFDLDAATDATVMDVFAPDRVGLLRDVAAAITDADASIVLARISTEGERATDAFYVVDSQTGEALVGPQRDRLADAVMGALS